jgi:hypothetical protein
MGWRRITGSRWTCLQRLPAWILRLLCFRGIAREYCKDLSYDGCNNMKWSTIQESPFVSVLIEKLVFQSWPGYTLYFMEHDIYYCVTVLLCYRVSGLACYCVTVLLCYRFTVLLWYRVAVLPCYCVTVLLCYRVTMLLLPCYGVTVLPCYCYRVTVNVLLLPCYRVTVLLFYRVTVLMCYFVTVLLCYRVTVLLCYRVTVLPCYRVTVLLCYRVTNSPQTVLTLSQTNLFGSIHYTIIRFTAICFLHLRPCHPSDSFPFVLTCSLLNAFLNSLIALTWSPKSPPPFLFPWWYLMERQNSRIEGVIMFYS